MAKKSLVGVNNVAKLIPNKGCVGVSNTAKKLLKGYVGVNNQAKLFWTSDTREKHPVLKPTIKFLPNVAYNLNKLEPRTFILASLKQALYLFIQDATARFIINAYIQNFNNIWSYYTQNIQNKDSIALYLNLRYDNNKNKIVGELTITGWNVDASNVTLRGPYVDLKVHRYYPTGMSVSSGSQTISCGYEDGTFSYTTVASRQDIFNVGGYYSFNYVNDNLYLWDSPSRNYSLTYMANNVGASIQETPIDPDDDLILSIDFIQDIAYSVDTSANRYVQEDGNNNLGLTYKEVANKVYQSNEGLIVNNSRIENLSWISGLYDTIAKFGNASIVNIRFDASTYIGGNLRSVYAYSFYNYSVTQQLDKIGYYWMDTGYDEVNHTTVTTWTFISDGDPDMFTDKLVQMHFTSDRPRTFDLYVDSEPLKTNIPCEFLYWFGYAKFSIGGTFELKKLKISRSRSIALDV